MSPTKVNLLVRQSLELLLVQTSRFWGFSRGAPGLIVAAARGTGDSTVALLFH